MGRFAPDMSGVSVNTPLYESGDYAVDVSKVRPIGYRKDNGVEVAGGKLILTMVGRIDDMSGNLIPDEEIKGKDVRPANMYIHTEGAMRMTKLALLAILGYNRDQEDEANEEHFSNPEDWDVDFDPDVDDGPVTLGEGWKELVGHRVIVTLGSEIYEGNEQQTHSGWRPFTP